MARLMAMWALAALAAGCVNLNAAYDDAARRACERQINSEDRLACERDADAKARERQAERARN